MRFLRSYSSIAHKEHFCNCCCRYIMPGEIYEGSVYSTKNGIIVSKQHSSPACDFPDPEEEFSMKRFEGLERALGNEIHMERVNVA